MQQNGVTILRASGLHRRLGEGAARVHALRGVDIEVERGAVCAISGPSGCGKTTLLYLLGLLDRPDAGEIWLAGEPMASAGDPARTAARGKLLGFVFQFHFLLPEFSALENVMLPMRKLGELNETQMRDRAQSLLADVGLADKAARGASELSGGEQQRVAIARALANDPALVLADEPTGNLDQANSQQVFDVLARLARSRGHAVLLATHNPELAARADDRRLMRDGLFVN